MINSRQAVLCRQLKTLNAVKGATRKGQEIKQTPGEPKRKWGKIGKIGVIFLYILRKLFTLLDDLSYTFFPSAASCTNLAPKNGRNISRSSRKIRNTITHSTRRNTQNTIKTYWNFLHKWRRKNCEKEKNKTSSVNRSLFDHLRLRIIHGGATEKTRRKKIIRYRYGIIFGPESEGSREGTSEK